MSNAEAGSQWTMLWLSFLALITCFIPYIGYSTKLMEIMEETSINYTQAGMLASVTALVGGIILPFVGVLVEKWGAKNIIVLGLVISAIGQLLFAYMPDYSWLIFSRALTGLGVGLLFVGPYTMAIKWFEKEGKIGIAMGVMFTSDGIGTAFALYLYAIVLSSLGWRHGSALGGAFIILVLLVTIFILKEPSHVLANKNKQVKHKFALKDYFNVIKNRNVIVATAFFVGEWGLYAVVAYWIPTILIEEAGWSESLAGFLTALYVLIGAIPSVIFGLMSDRMGKRKIFIVLAGLWMTFTVAALAVALYNNAYFAAAFIMPLIGLGVYTGMPVALALAAESVESNRVGIVNGFVLGTGFLVGGFAYPTLMGYIKDLTGEYTIGFIGAIVATLLLCFIIALTGRDVEHLEQAHDDETLIG